MTTSSAPAWAASRVLFGAAYYAEYRPSRAVAEDLDLMRDADFTVIRVGESVWSTWEPRDNEFDLEWLRPVLDGALARGIAVILGTPTYALPPWLQVKHPELAGETATGIRKPWGSRQEVDYSTDTFRGYAERVIRKILETYASHPAVIGFQVDNEPGSLLFHNDGAFAGFKQRLAAKYGTAARLNEAWGLTYWSHAITSFDELWHPDGNSFPQYDLAWREYQADLTSEFIHWQAEIVREYSSGEQFVTTCMAYPRPAQHDAKLAAGLDVVAGNPYFEMQDGLDLSPDETPPVPPFAVRGIGPFFRQADRMWSGRHERFLVTETNAQSIGGHAYNHPPYPGQLKQAAYGFISRGARLIEYWHWQTLNRGFETYWGGVLPHSGKPGRIYDEVSQIGTSLKRVGSSLDGYTPDADIAIVYSNASKWAFESFGPLRGLDGNPDPTSYTRIFDAFHTGIVESGRQAVIIHDVQLEAEDPADYAAAHPVLIVPALYIASDGMLQWIRDYAEAGGHLVLGIRTGYADLEAWAREEVSPPRLSDLAGVSYDEYSNIWSQVALVGSDILSLSDGAMATAWVDGLVLADATAIAHYQHRELGRFPAITTRATAAGRVTYVGTVPNPQLAEDLARWLVPTPHSAEWVGTPQNRVTVQSGIARGRRVRFIFNWSGDEVVFETPTDTTDLETGKQLPRGSRLVLSPRDTRILSE